MAGIPKPVPCLAILVLVAVQSVTMPAVDALKIGGVNVRQMVVSGRVLCLEAGDAPPLLSETPALARSFVMLTDVASPLMGGFTAPDGSFYFSVIDDVLNSIQNISNVKVRVPLPITNSPACSELAAGTGALEGIPVLDGPLVDGLANLIVTSFNRVA